MLKNYYKRHWIYLIYVYRHTVYTSVAKAGLWSDVCKAAAVDKSTTKQQITSIAYDFFMSSLLSAECQRSMYRTDPAAMHHSQRRAYVAITPTTKVWTFRALILKCRTGAINVPADTMKNKTRSGGTLSFHPISLLILSLSFLSRSPSLTSLLQSESECRLS